jgi:hypothetical protein
MVTASPTVQYNTGSEQDGRTPVFCSLTKKLLTRIDTESLTYLAGIQGGQWCWCRGCHMEHHVLWKDIKAN